MEFSLSHDVCCVCRSIYRQVRLKLELRRIYGRIGEIVACQINFALALDECIQSLRVECEGRDAICNIRLKSHAVDRLILDLQLGYTRGEIQTRIIDRSASFCRQVQGADDRNVSRLKRPKLIEADARGLYLAVVGSALWEVSDVALRRAGRHSYVEAATHFVAGALETHVCGLDGLIRNDCLGQVDRSLPDRTQLRSVQRDIGCDSACYRRL